MSEGSTSIGEKIDAVVDKWKSSNVLKKSVTVPVKFLVIGGVAVVLLALALSLSRRVEPQVAYLLGEPAVNAPLDVATANAAVVDLKKHISNTCKKK